MKNGKLIYYLRSRWEACSQQKCTYSQTQSSALVHVHWMQSTLLVYGKETEAVMKINSCKERNDVAGQSIEI